ncbi:MAG: UvrD-helicase domain-containing protein, partial [Verrucomicrobium sp.]
AGAGSGKTTELTRLMHAQIASGAVRPQAIIAATFTVAAAAELAERVRRELFAGSWSRKPSAWRNRLWAPFMASASGC